MTRQADYRAQLKQAPDPVAFLRMHSALPGPRANLELAQAAADSGDERTFRRWIKAGSGKDPTDEFVVLCGVVGLGRLVAEGDDRLTVDLKALAADPRWRVREGVVLGLQRLGDHSLDRLFRVAEPWSRSGLFAQRAAAAAVSEPRLLKAPSASRRAIDLLDAVTKNVATAKDRRAEDFRALRQALAYCWSVGVAANPPYGKPILERLARSANPDVRWIVKENLKKARLVKVDPTWTKRLAKQLEPRS
jgi:hypothetical protein